MFRKLAIYLSIELARFPRARPGRPAGTLYHHECRWTYVVSDWQDIPGSVLLAYRVADEALLPVMINVDAFSVTHTSEVVHVTDQEEVDRFLPPYNPATDGKLPLPRLSTRLPKYGRTFTRIFQPGVTPGWHCGLAQQCLLFSALCETELGKQST